MMGRAQCGIAAVAVLAGLLAPAAAEPLRLHPDNPHYFLFRGKPTVLVGSTEHYGAVLYRDFDYVRYLDALAADGLNLTRTFSGAYVEVPGSFNIVNNTLAPPQEKFLCPWQRTDKPGAAGGQNKFDLEAWNPVYFERLKDFVAQAGKRGIVVEFVFFSAIYDEQLWATNPLNSANNVNLQPPIGRLEVFTLQHAKLTDYELALVRKIAQELRDADNVYYEICNEPYFGNVTPQWNDRVVLTLVAAEKDFPARHLVAQNIANGAAVVKDPHPNVSILNFHYATPPDTVAQNYALKLALGDDETGFRGTSDEAYRTEGWDFMLASGATYNNLDYSFSVEHPAGTQPVVTSPGGGGKALRQQLGILKKFVDGFELVKMSPAGAVVKAGVPDKGSVRVLAEPGKQYALYVRGRGPVTLRLDLPAGSYRAEWLDTKTGQAAGGEGFEHAGGERELKSPAFEADIALGLRAR